MSHELLGDSFDIHGGGIDLQFPHHENEIAQSMCAHPDADFARFWLHNEMLQVEGKKMSKSLGNFFTVRDLLDKGVPGEVIRFVFLSTHYSKPMDWTEEKAKQAARTLRKWREMTEGVNVAGNVPLPVLQALADDLNTAGALAELHGFARDGQVDELKAGAALLGLLGDNLGAWAKAPGIVLDAFAERLGALRETARETKDYVAADSYRDALIAAGVSVSIAKDGIVLAAGPDIDLAKLKALK